MGRSGTVLFDRPSAPNPHAYFTKVFERAFLRRIAKEKKQDYIRNKIKMGCLNLPDLDWVVEYEKKDEERLGRIRDRKTLLRFM